MTSTSLLLYVLSVHLSPVHPYPLHIDTYTHLRMGKKKSKSQVFVLKPWCWYCEREFEDEKGKPFVAEHKNPS